MPGGRRSPKGFEQDPGPAHYEFDNKQIGIDALKYTMKPKIQSIHDPLEQAKRHGSPGPGTYKSIGIDKDGKYSVSNIPNSKASVWSPSKSKRFKDELHSNLKNPPPGTYNPSD